MRTANRQAVVGLGLVACARSAVMFLVTDLLYGSAPLAPLTAALAVLVASTWFALPLWRRHRGDP